MTLDEAIEYEKESLQHCKRMLEEIYEDNLENKILKFEVKQHEHLAEWLEDYKHIKQWKSDVMDEFCKYDCNSIEEVYKSGYKKALFDIKAKMKEINNATKPIEGVIENGWGTRFVDLAYINKISEQLKVGVTND